MALKKFHDPDSIVGFLVLEPGNRVEGTLEEPRITGTNDAGEPRGSLCIRCSQAGTKISREKVEFTARKGDLVGVTIAAGTRCLLSEVGTYCAVTFMGFGKARPGQKPFQQYELELDDGGDAGGDADDDLP